jgi:hypothetical protein
MIANDDTYDRYGGLSNGLFNLAGRHPHDMDGVADHVGGALLAFRASGHLFVIGG